MSGFRESTQQRNSPRARYAPASVCEIQFGRLPEGVFRAGRHGVNEGAHSQRDHRGCTIICCRQLSHYPSTLFDGDREHLIWCRHHADLGRNNWRTAGSTRDHGEYAHLPTGVAL